MAVLVLNETFSPSDYYPFMTESNIVKWAAWTISFLHVLTGPCALYSVIWYERYGSDRKRTLLNMLVSKLCWTAIAYIFAVQMVELARHITGPLFGIVCLLYMLSRIVLTVMAVLLLNGVIISR